MWDRLFRMVLLQAFHVWRWSSAGRARISDAQSFAQLAHIFHNATFNSFVGSSMTYFRTESGAPPGGVPPQPQFVDLAAATLHVAGLHQDAAILEYFNSVVGKEHRGNTGRHRCRAISERVCKLCHGLVRQRTTYSCIECLMPLCVDFTNRDAIDNEPTAGALTSCWDLWYDRQYEISAGRGRGGGRGRGARGRGD